MKAAIEMLYYIKPHAGFVVYQNPAKWCFYIMLNRAGCESESGRLSCRLPEP